MRVHYLGGGLAIGLLACSSGGADGRFPSPPALVSVSFLGVTAGPGSSNLEQWDGPGHVDPALVSSVARALGAVNPYLSLTALLAGPLNDALAKPDPFGKAMLFDRRGASMERRLNVQPNTFLPQWEPPAVWTHVPLDGSTRIRVQLWDEDPVNNDPMGTFEINADDLLAALSTERVYQVRVDDQTGGRVLLAAISVLEE
jgi:hypothetical protein